MLVEAEHVVKAKIRKSLGMREDIRLFTNPVGNGWISVNGYFRGDSYVLPHPRRISFGLCKGSADLVGWQSLEITPAMVGQKIARFLSIEVKTATGQPTEEQMHWANVVRDAGGVAGIVRSADEARRLVG